MFLSVLKFVLASLIGYLFGCFQTAYIIGKIKGNIDIRLHGTNNAGASNITRVMGWKYGIITALLDILKGTAAVILVGFLFPDKPALLFTAGAFVVLGHIFPVFLGFKGGKGTASLIGISLAIDLKIAIVIVLALVIITIVTDYIALGSLAMYTLFPLMALFYKYPLSCIVILTLLCFIGFYKHSINIKRMLSREEVGLRQVAKRRE